MTYKLDKYCNMTGWLLEGTAVYNANQMGVNGYFAKEEIFDKIRDGYSFLTG